MDPDLPRLSICLQPGQTTLGHVLYPALAHVLNGSRAGKSDKLSELKCDKLSDFRVLRYCEYCNGFRGKRAEYRGFRVNRL